MNVSLCSNMAAGGDAARTGQDRPVHGDTSRVGDVTGRINKLMEAGSVVENVPIVCSVHQPRFVSCSSAVARHISVQMKPLRATLFSFRSLPLKEEGGFFYP